MMDNQTFQIVLMVAAGAISFIAARIWTILSDLQKRDRELTDKIQDLQLMLSDKLQGYQKREEAKEAHRVIFAKLDRIDDELRRRVGHE